MCLQVTELRQIILLGRVGRSGLEEEEKEGLKEDGLKGRTRNDDEGVREK